MVDGYDILVSGNGLVHAYGWWIFTAVVFVCLAGLTLLLVQEATAFGNTHHDSSRSNREWTQEFQGIQIAWTVPSFGVVGIQADLVCTGLARRQSTRQWPESTAGQPVCEMPVRSLTAAGLPLVIGDRQFSVPSASLDPI